MCLLNKTSFVTACLSHNILSSLNLIFLIFINEQREKIVIKAAKAAPSNIFVPFFCFSISQQYHTYFV